jgi:hypothetical protein
MAPVRHAAPSAGRRLVLIPALVAVLCTPGAAAPQAPRPVSVEATIGRWTGWATRPSQELGDRYAADLLAGARLRALGDGAAAVALSAGFIGGSRAHLESCGYRPETGCTPYMPGWYVVSGYGGWETRDAGARVLTGPALASLYGDRRMAWHGRVDIAPVRVGPLGIMGSARLLVVPAYYGDTFLYLTVGGGLRLR